MKGECFKALQCVVVLWLTAFCPIQAADKPNVLLLCIDDLRPELACFGKDYVKSPHIDKLAARGRARQSAKPDPARLAAQRH